MYNFESTFDKLAYTGNHPEAQAILGLKAYFIDIFRI
jgi:hypothetical protein